MPAKLGPLRPHEEGRAYARHKFYEPPPGQPGLGDSFLIVTEGEVTEKSYFEAVRSELQLSAVKVRVVHPNRTDAEGLVREAAAERECLRSRHAGFAGNHEVTSYDHVWVLFDTDVSARQGQLERALELARRENIHVGHSTPSIEFWLLLHFGFTTASLLDSNAAERRVSELWQNRYDKSAATFRELWKTLRPRIQEAVNHAGRVRHHHSSADTRFPANPSTELDLLVRALNASVQPGLRLFH